MRVPEAEQRFRPFAWQLPLPAYHLKLPGTSLARWATMSKSFAYDLRHEPVRGLLRSPGFAAPVVVLSLALGVGANTAIFSLIDQALLRPLPAEDPEQLVLLSCNGPSVGKFWGFRQKTATCSPTCSTGNWSARTRPSSACSVGCAPEANHAVPVRGPAARPSRADLVTGSYFGCWGRGRPRVVAGPAMTSGRANIRWWSCVRLLEASARRLADSGGNGAVNGQSMTVVGVA